MKTLPRRLQAPPSPGQRQRAQFQPSPEASSTTTQYMLSASRWLGSVLKLPLRTHANTLCTKIASGPSWFFALTFNQKNFSWGLKITTEQSCLRMALLAARSAESMMGPMGPDWPKHVEHGVTSSFSLLVARPGACSGVL